MLGVSEFGSNLVGVEVEEVVVQVNLPILGRRSMKTIEKHVQTKN